MGLFNFTKEKVMDGKPVDLEKISSQFMQWLTEGSGAAWLANIKRTYDEQQGMDSTVSKQNRSHFDALMAGNQSLLDKLNTSYAHAFNNMVENSNMAMKQLLKSERLATNADWSDLEAAAGNRITADSVVKDDVALQVVKAFQAFLAANGLAGRPVGNPTGTDPQK